MTPDRYDTNLSEDEVLPNKLGLTDRALIDEEEGLGFARAELDATLLLAEEKPFSVAYLLKLHGQALGHLYDFAGRVRTVNMSKDGFAFPAAEFLTLSLQEFENEFLKPFVGQGSRTDPELLNHIAAIHAELLYIHPFREGNGRVVRLFTKLVSLAVRGVPIEFETINTAGNFARYVQAVQQAAIKEYSLMQELFAELKPGL